MHRERKSWDHMFMTSCMNTLQEWYIVEAHKIVSIYLYSICTEYVCVPWAFLLPTVSSLVKSCLGTFAWAQESNWDYMAWLRESWQYECIWQQKVLLLTSMQVHLGKAKEERTIKGCLNVSIKNKINPMGKFTWYIFELG